MLAGATSVFTGTDGAINNTGVINDSAGGALYVNGFFSNTGDIEGTGAGTANVDILATTDIMYGNGTLDTGTIAALAGDTLALNLNNGLITTDRATLMLQVAGSDITGLTSAGSNVALESSLLTIAAGANWRCWVSAAMRTAIV